MSSYASSSHKRILSQAGSSFTLVCFIVFVKVFVFQLYHQAHHHRRLQQPQQVAAFPVLDHEEESHPALGRRLLQAAGGSRGGGGSSECLGLLKCLSVSDGQGRARENRSKCLEYYKSCQKARNAGSRRP